MEPGFIFERRKEGMGRSFKNRTEKEGKRL